jgi:hypothetical protein
VVIEDISAAEMFVAEKQSRLKCAALAKPARIRKPYDGFLLSCPLSALAGVQMGRGGTRRYPSHHGAQYATDGVV